MNCECGGKTQTKDTRKIEQGIWRRRKCVECHSEFTTLEQRCETVRTPYTAKRTGDKRDGQVVAPPKATVDAPRARAPKAPKATPAGKAAFTPAPRFQRAPAPSISIPPRTDKTYPEPKVVDRNEPSARDRIEDMKFERSQRDHGWD